MSDISHAAMCVYCGDTVIYDTRQVTDMEAAHQQIVEHDQQCPKNPLVARIRALEAERDALAAQIAGLTEGMALVPREITAETGHKAGMMGEFFERIADTCPQCEGYGRHDASDCDLCDCMGEVTREVGVSWTTIKAIHMRIVEIAEKSGRKG